MGGVGGRLGVREVALTVGQLLALKPGWGRGCPQVTLLPLASFLSEQWDSGHEGGNGLGDGVRTREATVLSRQQWALQSDTRQTTEAGHTNLVPGGVSSDRLEAECVSVCLKTVIPILGKRVWTTLHSKHDSLPHVMRVTRAGLV